MTTTLRGPVRIGAVNYLNSKPLIEGLADSDADLELHLDYPSCLADRLAEGILDVALVPSIEVLQIPEYEIVSDACVATDGPVMSVKLFSRVPLGEMRRLAVDAGSRTSAALVRIMLAGRYGVEPELELLPLGLSTDATDADAVLLIGDRAIRPQNERFAATWDLGQEWLQWTGLPFVFAMWAARADTELGPIEDELARARDRGVQRLDEIAAREAPLLGISRRTAYDYLTDNLHYRLGSAERSGLKLFHELAADIALVPQGVDLVFRNCTPA